MQKKILVKQRSENPDVLLLNIVILYGFWPIFSTFLDVKIIDVTFKELEGIFASLHYIQIGAVILTTVNVDYRQPIRPQSSIAFQMCQYHTVDSIYIENCIFMVDFIAFQSPIREDKPVLQRWSFVCY